MGAPAVTGVPEGVTVASVPAVERVVVFAVVVGGSVAGEVASVGETLAIVELAVVGGKVSMVGVTMVVLGNDAVVVVGSVVGMLGVFVVVGGVLVVVVGVVVVGVVMVAGVVVVVVVVVLVVVVVVVVVLVSSSLLSTCCRRWKHSSPRAKRTSSTATSAMAPLECTTSITICGQRWDTLTAHPAVHVHAATFRGNTIVTL